MIKRFLYFVLAWVVLIAAFPMHAFALGADADTPQTHPNTYKNTGNQRADIVGVALTQVGYREGAGNNTKYGAALNINKLGWCGAFVSWCAIQAGIPDSVMKKTGTTYPANFGLTQEPAGYIPKPGDLFFNVGSHVGLVYYAEGEYFYSLEGNTWEGNGGEGVYIRKHKISNVVFASPKYAGEGNHSYVTESETAHPHKVYYRCTDCGDQYYSGATTKRDDCLQCKQASCSHSYSTWTRKDDNNHTRSCSKCQLTETKAHKWNSGTVTKAASCSETGIKTQTCTDCNAEKTSIISKTNEHVYSEWICASELDHIRSCSVCGKQESKLHEKGTGWYTSETEHWFACSLCGFQMEPDEHQFGEECDSPCEVCEFVSESGHQFSSTWQTDDKSHWYSCQKCDLQKEQGEHTFTAECDDSCDTCGYSRVTQHSFSEVYTTDSWNHWYECSVCGKQESVGQHISGEAAYEGAATFCTVCQLQLTEASEHTHFYSEVQTDTANHWGSCVCGQEMEVQAHSWSVRSGACSVCGAVLTVPEGQDQDLTPWIIGGGGLIVLLMLVVFLVIFRKRD